MDTNVKSTRTVVVALGGNAIPQPGQVGTFEEQLFSIDGAMRRIAELAQDGRRVVLRHGNGPQAGNLLIQNALAATTVAPMPMDVRGAESQGQIGYMAAQTLANHLRKRRLEAPMVTIVTQVAVDPKDKAFSSPSKPAGPFYSEREANKMMLEEGLAMREDAGRGWRRVVPSPEPKEIVELEAVRDLVENALLARELGADAILNLTDAPKAYIDYGTPEQAALDRVTASQMRAYAAEGHFKAGSMSPKAAASAAMSDENAGGNGKRSAGRQIVAQIVDSAGRPRFPFDERIG